MDAAGVVVPLKVDPGHPLAAEVAVSHVKAAVAAYEAQKGPLQQRLGGDVFVAQCYGRKDDDGKVYTYSVWSKDVPTLLPRTHYVMLLMEPGVEGGEIIRAPWEKLAEIVGDHMSEEPDIDPARWRTLRWPSGDMLVRLRS